MLISLEPEALHQSRMYCQGMTEGMEADGQETPFRRGGSKAGGPNALRSPRSPHQDSKHVKFVMQIAARASTH